MLRRHIEFYLQYLQVLDGILLCVSLWVAHTLRHVVFPELRFLDLSPVAPFTNYEWMLVLILALGPILLERQGYYRFSLTHSLWQSLLAVLRAVILLLILITVIMAVFKVKQESVSRVALFLFIPVSAFTLGVREAALRVWLRRRGQSLLSRQHVILCGNTRERELWRRELAAMPGQNYEVCDEVDLAEITAPQFIQKLHEHSIHLAIFSIDHSSVSDIRQALLACESEGIEAWVSADFFKTALTRPQFDQFAGHPLLVYRSTPDASWQLAAKRMVDMLGSAVLLLLLSPILLVVAALIRLTMGSPVIFSQKRNGLYGKPFTMYKFRTMTSNAEQQRDELVNFNLMKGPVFKVEKDPRVTPLGRWLRRNSIDELPQLWNVLKGEMSLVGPRPLPVYETANFDDFSQRRRMSVRPGLTCLWQIAGRNEITDFDQWVELDLKYIDDWSLWLDFKILLLTLPVVLFRKGAK